MRRIIRNRFLPLVFFFYVMFPFYLESIYQINYIGFHLCMIVYVIYNRRDVMEIALGNKQGAEVVKIFLCGWIVLLLHSLVISISINGNSETFYKFIFSILREVLRGTVLILITYKTWNSENENEIKARFTNYYIFSCMLYIMSTIYMLFDFDFRVYWNGIVHQVAEAKATLIANGYIAEITRTGFGGYSGINYSLMCTFGIILESWIIMDLIRREEKGIYKHFACIICMGIGNLFYGRTGLIISLLCLCILAYYIAKRNLFLIIKFVAFLSMISVVLAFSLSMIDDSEKWVEWSLEPILRISDYFTGDSNNLSIGESGDSLIDMYKETQTADLLIGTGDFPGDNDRDFFSDIGWIRVASYGGLVGFIIYYSMIIIMMYNMRKNIVKKDSGARLILTLILVSFFVFESKGTAYSYHLNFTFIIFYILMVEDKRINKV